MASRERQQGRTVTVRSLGAGDASRGHGRARDERRFPRIGLLGVVLIGVGSVEALVSALAAPGLVDGHHGSSDAHLLVFSGMVLVLVGMARDVRARRSGLGTTDQIREDHDALR